MSATPVFFHVSSLIGYVRVVLSAYALYVALDDYKTSLFCYVFSFVLDFFDGYFSRRLHESPRFHSILDTVTDRCSTGGLLVVLSHLYPRLMHVFLFLLILDFSSHWYHMQSSHGPHKRVCSDRNYLLRLYYGLYPFFGYCCIGTELFYLLLYTLHFDSTLVLPVVDVSLQSICLRVCLPACILKSLVNIAQLASGAYAIADEDAAHEK
ncbi:hypothetical protein PINS_up015494 [Pythium insidiosum]|nr:hypothetical protein PINS_up015494 [Pythium insidiosum]